MIVDKGIGGGADAVGRGWLYMYMYELYHLVVESDEENVRTCNLDSVSS
jgi:hypothetical protein